jgi:uncharacterized protein YneF (UPF0154 family)
MVLTTPNANLDSEDRRDSDAQLVAGEPRITVPNQARGVNDDSLDVGFSLGAVSGFVWRDLDRNGLRDPGEPFINGVTVELLDSSDNLIDTQTTRSILNDPFNRAGFFEFTSVPLTATYRVRIPSTEFDQSTDLLFGHATPQTQTVSLPQIGNQGLVDGSTPGPAVVGPTNYLATAQFTLDATNRRNETSNFGLYAGTVGDFVWHDVNRNGIVDPLETTLGLANALVFVDLDSDCLIDTNELTTTTDLTGYYRFDSLPLGYTYTVVLDASNFAPGGALEGLGYTTGAACGSTEGVVITTTLLTANTPADFGVDFGIARAEIGNFVWEDDNGNGIFDLSESGVPSVTVQLYGAGPDDTFFTADDVSVGLPQTTNVSGTYTITDILSGTYYATFDLSALSPDYVASVYTPTGWLSVDPQSFDDVNDVRAFVGGRVWRTPTFTITRGSQNPGVDAAVFRPVTVVARVFEENPPVDNVYQMGDTGITTATVTITTTNGTVTPLSVVSDTTGLITFTLVPTTTPYWVNVAAPPGFTPSPGNSGAVQITPDPISGDTVGPTGLEFGYFRAVTVVARVFEENPPVDNVYQAGDTGITTATVTITTTNGAVTPLSVVSDTTGLITFTLVPTSNTTPYWVNVATPTGFTPSPGNGGAREVTPNPGPGGSAGVFEFGYFRAVTVVARVFEENPPVNNVYQAGDTGITTATVTITTTNGTVTPLSVVSDTTGLITFTLVPTSNTTPYWVNVATPTGFAPSPGNSGATQVTPNPQPGGSAGVFEFGYFRAVTVVARVFEENPPVNNVYQAGDTGITTATVTITTTNGTVTPLSVVSDTTGLITFTLVPTSNTTPYWVNVATPTGFTPSPGNGGAREVTPNPGPGDSAGVFEFGYFRAVTVVARVFEENPPVNNVYQAGDTGITTATVTITTTNGTVTPLSVVSDTTGLITFTLVPTSNTTPYWVNVATPTGFTPSPGNGGAREVTPNPGPGGSAGVFEFGYFRAVTVVARVFEENPPVNNVYQAGDTGITTATVTITTTNGAVTPLSVVSDTTGLITFTLVPTSNTTPYWVNVATPTGFTPSPGNGGAREVTPNPGPGGSAGVFQFGYFRAVTVVARVFEENPPVNNVYQAGDTGITTATVTITTTNGMVTPLSVVSDTTGLITFTLVPTSNTTPYWVNVATPTGFTPSPGNGGALEVTPNPGPGDSAGVFEFGYFRAVTVVARVFEENPPVNNVYQAGDTGITTATVTITTTNGTVTPLSVVSDTTGLITFTLVPTSNTTPYWVNVATPTGFTPSPGNGGAREVTPNPGPGDSAGVFEFGYFRAVTVVARVFEENPPVDNVYQAGDTGITTATVTITTTNGTVTPLSVVSDTTGLITFTLVPTSNTTPYWVNVATPTGFTPSPGNGGAREVTPNPGPGGSAGVFEFGYFRAVTVVARVFEELTNLPPDNAYTPGDTGITTATVTITTTNGTVTPLSVVSDTTGLITFTLVPTSNTTPYWVNVATPTGFTPSSGNGGAREVTPNPGPGDSAGVFEFGYFRAVTVVARVFEENPPVDNAYQAGDTGITTATVTITTTNGTVTPLSVVSDTTGLITFTLVPTDSATPYWVNVEPIAGFERSPGNTGAAQVTPNPTPGQTVGPLGLEFGYFRPGTVTGTVRFDRDGDNVLFADNEPGMQGVTVTLRLGGSDVLITTTDATGAYTFTNVTPNISYTVRVTNPDTLNFELVTPAAATMTWRRPIGNTYAETAPFTVTSGAAISRTAAVRGRATVTGQVWEDLNGNGQRETGEDASNLPNVPVTLTVNVDLPGLLSTTITTSTVTSGGFYTFTALPGCVTGTNQVSFTLGFATPSGWFATPSDVGPQPANNDSDGIGTGVDQLNDQELQVGLTQTRDRGYYRPAVIQVRVFEENPPVNNSLRPGGCAALGDDHADAKRDARSAIGAGCDRHHHLHRGADNDRICDRRHDASRIHAITGEHRHNHRGCAADEQYDLRTA